MKLESRPSTLSKTILEVADDLRTGRTTSRALTEEAFARIDDPAGEGARTFIQLFRERALVEAEASDRLRAAGIVASPIAGIPISVKDLFDVAGSPTRAGSLLLADGPPAAADAPAIARLRRAGAIIVGKTNMTEFAYSGLGLNPHYGTPRSTYDRATGRVPGGSSSGAAISVADGMVVAAIGSDTGGSVRVPAAFNGITGFKSTTDRIPRAGAFPLSTTLDSIGPLGRSVVCCGLLDAIMAGESCEPLPMLPLDGLQFLVPTNGMLDDLDSEVETAFARALDLLGRAGARITRGSVAAFDRVGDLLASGGIAGIEALAFHESRLASARNRIDHRVAARLDGARNLTAADYIRLLELRRQTIGTFSREIAPFAALLMPTAPCLPPIIADLTDDNAYVRTNIRVLRNTIRINQVDGCALSVPIPASNGIPVGLMIAGGPHADQRILQVGVAIEAVFDAATMGGALT